MLGQDSNMENVLNEIISDLIDSGLASGQSFVGCKNEEINELETHFNVKFPKIYRLFLKKMGKAAGNFMLGTDMFYKHLFGIRDGAIELLQEANSHYTLSHTMFVFSMHQGYEFCCFDTLGGEDPEVFQYIEDEDRPEKQWNTFSEYLKDMIHQHRLALGQS